MLYVVGGEANNAAVFAADAVLAGELTNDNFTDRQYGESQVARHDDVLPSDVGAKWHHATSPCATARCNASGRS